jgi:ferredoxin
MRFAEEVGDLRGPRRGPLAVLGRPPLEVRGLLCPGSARCHVCIESCPARALRPGADGHPTIGGGACTSCGECIARCPQGALGHAHAPWPALNARLEALLANARAGPVALVLSERSEPPPPDGPRETAQPDVPWIMPMELPRGALGAGIVLRALELGAAAVCAVVPGDDARCAAGVEAAIALACAVGEGDRVSLARSLDEAIERLRGPLRPAHPASEPVPREPTQRPDARTIALSMWRQDESRTPRCISGPGAPGGAVAVNGDGCTLCGLCVSACPTGALAQRRERTVALRFDSSLCPFPCGRCESACPVRALTVSPELRLPPEHVTLVARAGTCARCGELWPEAASVAALGPKLAPGDAPALLRFLSTCPDCRSRALGSSLRVPEASERG